MIRTLWYILKIGLLLGAVAWLTSLPGEVLLSWGVYKIEIQAGVLAAGFFFLFLLMFYASALSYRIVSFPKAYMRYRAQKRQARGYKALLRSLTAASVGDYKNARYLAYRAQQFLPESEKGFPLLVQAQALRELGKDKQGGLNIDEPYELLLKNAETTLLGLQGLIQNAILASDFPKALVVAREAVRKYPKNFRLLQTVYDLEIRNRLWSDALKTLDLAVKNKIIAKDRGRADRAALYCVLGDMAVEAGRQSEGVRLYKKALDADATFEPAVMRLARLFMTIDQKDKAASVVFKAWKKFPHPDYARIWMEACPARKGAGAVFKWTRKIAAYHKDSLEAVLALAEAAIIDSLWGEARDLLMRAEKISPDSRLYALWVRLEEGTTNRPDVIRQWMDRARHAPDAAVWVCSKTGRRYPVWQAVVEPEGHFNTLVWQSTPAAAVAAGAPMISSRDAA